MKLENLVSDKIFAIYILYKDNIYRCSNLFIYLFQQQLLLWVIF